MMRTWNTNSLHSTAKLTFTHFILRDFHEHIGPQRILGECLLISSLPGEALSSLVDIAMLVETKGILGECLLISSFKLYRAMF